MHKKVAVIGLDGMAWHILNKLFEYDAMPYLRVAIDNSLRGVLKSTIPPLTPPAWTSIATGVNPGKHGIFDFLSVSSDYDVSLASSRDVHYPRIHEMIALKGLKAVCINQPLTYPIIRMENIFVVSDWISPKLYYYPRSLSKYVKSYKLSTPVETFIKNPRLAVNESLGRINAVNQLIKELDWNLFWVIYTEPDHIFHGCYDKIMQGDNHLLKIFEEIDKTIKIASKRADMTLIVSDHGFSEYKYLINVNSILYNLGFAAKTWKRITKSHIEFLTHHHGISVDNVKRIKLPLRLQKLLFEYPFLKSVLKKFYRKLAGKELRAEIPDVDPFRSKAFLLSGTSHGIYVKDQTMIDCLINKLKKVEGIKRIYRREEVFRGPYLNKAAQVLIEPDYDKGYTIAATAKIAPKSIFVETRYSHHPDGIIISFGKGIPALWLKEPVQAVDIVPTILRYMNLPLPIDTDGTPIQYINYPQKQVEYFDYLKHWKLIKQIHLKKSKLSI